MHTSKKDLNNQFKPNKLTKNERQRSICLNRMFKAFKNYSDIYEIEIIVARV